MKHIVLLNIVLIVCLLALKNQQETMARKSKGQKNNDPRRVHRRQQYAIRQAKKAAVAKLCRDVHKAAQTRQHREKRAKQETIEKAKRV